MFWVFMSCVLGVVSAVLAAKIILTKKALKDITKDFKSITEDDTNSVLTVSTSDRFVCNLADELNTQLKLLRKERLRLENGNNELQNAITNIAHDIRTPLTAVSGYLELLEEEKLEEKSAGYVAVIRERTETLKMLSEELFRYSVVVTEAYEPENSEVSLNDELEVALIGVYSLFKCRNIEPEIVIPDEPVKRVTDRKLLQRIFGNILNNAAKYSAGDLIIRLDPEGDITFSNFAPGLTEVDVGRLFERFYTVESGKGSTGIGLSIAKYLTEKINGTISAALTDSTLTIRLRI